MKPHDPTRDQAQTDAAPGPAELAEETGTLGPARTMRLNLSASHSARTGYSCREALADELRRLADMLEANEGTLGESGNGGVCDSHNWSLHDPFMTPTEAKLYGLEIEGTPKRLEFALHIHTVESTDARECVVDELRNVIHELRQPGQPTEADTVTPRGNAVSWKLE